MDYKPVIRIAELSFEPVRHWKCRPAPRTPPYNKKPYSRLFAMPHPLLHPFFTPPSPPKVRQNFENFFPQYSWVPRLPGKHSRLVLIYTSSFLHLNEGYFRRFSENYLRRPSASYNDIIIESNILKQFHELESC